MHQSRAVDTEIYGLVSELKPEILKHFRGGICDFPKSPVRPGSQSDFSHLELLRTVPFLRSLLRLGFEIRTTNCARPFQFVRR